uniref:Uncharacterized protein n=1 Tax=Arundo donax TaxID=35708 RepID=A0A0A9BKF5_ARUDO
MSHSNNSYFQETFKVCAHLFLHFLYLVSSLKSMQASAILTYCICCVGQSNSSVYCSQAIVTISNNPTHTDQSNW